MMAGEHQGMWGIIDIPAPLLPTEYKGGRGESTSQGSTGNSTPKRTDFWTTALGRETK